MDALLSAYELGPMPLANRVVMAPMTRSRARDGQADENTATYYAQRAGAGLIVSEGVPISAQGTGYLYTPGIHRETQVAAWRRVTQAVREQGGRIVAQLWHVGRVSHRSLQPDGRAPVSSVAVAGGQAFAYHPDGTPGNMAASRPEALDEGGIQAVIEDFRRAAANAMAAGFDGVEIHAANGYLIEQFINPILNTREDRYGGATLESRSRLLLEVVDEVNDEIGAERVGVRLSPYNELQEMPRHADTAETYLYIADALERRKIAYVHLVVQGQVMSSGLLARFRQRWHGTLISAGGLTAEQADRLIKDGLTDLAAFGTPFVANPDFVERIRHGWPLASVDRSAFYGGGAEGYIDYPTYPASLVPA
ncbi:alkene reductase [Halomonas organivorans]|uniref:2,4-dienoyl-CoA reductase-like NADH-dependent reductase (Old Yellow Enzyme family) n=1 Tax=Halomonas organivorans TaxID=257772 RepID=A0A7W5G4E4_9GAMM|nr:alkene reductase [Halomonas organivorans]MBB3139877.1 2,4-dienoyl-CoA reductase-like NADH-dependent reductase (Old Yellow Enzyme family) [Halomonas organivorans]